MHLAKTQTLLLRTTRVESARKIYTLLCLQSEQSGWESALRNRIEARFNLNPETLYCKP